MKLAILFIMLPFLASAQLSLGIGKACGKDPIVLCEKGVDFITSNITCGTNPETGIICKVNGLEKGDTVFTCVIYPGGSFTRVEKANDIAMLIYRNDVPFTKGDFVTVFVSIEKQKT